MSLSFAALEAETCVEHRPVRLRIMAGLRRVLVQAFVPWKLLTVDEKVIKNIFLNLARTKRQKPLKRMRAWSLVVLALWFFTLCLKPVKAAGGGACEVIAHKSDAAVHTESIPASF